MQDSEDMVRFINIETLAEDVIDYLLRRQHRCIWQPNLVRIILRQLLESPRYIVSQGSFGVCLGYYILDYLLKFRGFRLEPSLC